MYAHVIWLDDVSTKQQSALALFRCLRCSTLLVTVHASLSYPINNTTNHKEGTAIDIMWSTSNKICYYNRVDSQCAGCSACVFVVQHPLYVNG